MVQTMEVNETEIRDIFDEVPQQKKKKGPKKEKRQKKGAWKVVLAVILVLGIAGSVAVSAVTLFTVKTYIAKVEEQNNPKTSEDYVKIAESYEIKPTTQISNAYKSGDTKELTDKEKETLDMAKSALEEMKIKDDMSDYEKEKAVYDWMTKELQQDRGALTVIPATQEDCDNPYGVLKYHNAVCVGYATTFRMFMQMLDIECMVEHNTERFHSWNLVKLDGDWYITDIYSDAGTGNYASFNVTDTIWGQNQSWDHDYFPAATSLKYNMAYQNKVTVDKVTDIPKALREAMDKKLGGVMIAFKEKIDDDKAQIASAITSLVDEKLMNGNFKDMPFCLGNYSWLKDPDSDEYLFNVSMASYNDSTADTGLSEKEMEKLREAVEKAFEGLKPADGSSMGEMGGMDMGTEESSAASSNVENGGSVEIP